MRVRKKSPQTRLFAYPIWRMDQHCRISRPIAVLYSTLPCCTQSIVCRNHPLWLISHQLLFASIHYWIDRPPIKSCPISSQAQSQNPPDKTPQTRHAFSYNYICLGPKDSISIFPATRSYNLKTPTALRVHNNCQQYHHFGQIINQTSNSTIITRGPCFYTSNAMFLDYLCRMAGDSTTTKLHKVEIPTIWMLLNLDQHLN